MTLPGDDEGWEEDEEIIVGEEESGNAFEATFAPSDLKNTLKVI